MTRSSAVTGGRELMPLWRGVLSAIVLRVGDGWGERGAASRRELSVGKTGGFTLATLSPHKCQIQIDSKFICNTDSVW